MNFTILTPSDSPLQDDKSSMTDTRFGGQRKKLNTSVADSKDYTKRTGAAPNKKENPENAVKDIDDMANSEERKREFSYQEDKKDVQKNNEADFIVKSDADGGRPRMDEGSDAVQVPEASDTKHHRKPNQWHFGKSGSVYDGEIR
jgi:hypothetical protein